jgi:hypothetical protein
MSSVKKMAKENSSLMVIFSWAIAKILSKFWKNQKYMKK